MWGRNFLKRKISPPHPLFKEIATGLYLKIYIVRSAVVLWYSIGFFFATFLKKSGSKNFQRKVFDAHCALDHIWHEIHKL